MTTEREVDELLGEVYTERGIEIWWQSRNRNLGRQRPVALWAEGYEGQQRVLGEAERLAGGAW